MSKFELKQVVGRVRIKGKVRRIGWPMDLLLMNGEQIATVNRVSGSAIGLMSHAILTEKDKKELADFMAENREGKKPAMIGSPVKQSFEYLDDEEDETDVDDE